MEQKRQSADLESQVLMPDFDPNLTELEGKSSSVETSIDVLCADFQQLNDCLLAIRTTNFRLMFGTLIAIGLGLSGMMAKGFGWL